MSCLSISLNTILTIPQCVKRVCFSVPWTVRICATSQLWCVLSLFMHVLLKYSCALFYIMDQNLFCWFQWAEIYPGIQMTMHVCVIMNVMWMWWMTVTVHYDSSACCMLCICFTKNKQVCSTCEPMRRVIILAESTVLIVIHVAVLFATLLHCYEIHMCLTSSKSSVNVNVCMCASVKSVIHLHSSIYVLLKDLYNQTNSMYIYCVYKTYTIKFVFCKNYFLFLYSPRCWRYILDTIPFDTSNPIT